MDLAPELADLGDERGLVVWRVREVEARVVRDDDGELGRHDEDVAEGPRLEDVERDVDVRVEERLERDEALLDLLRAVPSLVCARCCARGDALRGPAPQEDLHRVDGLPHGVKRAAEACVYLGVFLFVSVYAHRPPRH